MPGNRDQGAYNMGQKDPRCLVCDVSGAIYSRHRVIEMATLL